MKQNTNIPAKAKSRAHRPKVSFNVDDEMSSGKDSDNGATLPIVELKPFVQKVWRREKSFPSFYQNNEVTHTNGRKSTVSRSQAPEMESEPKTEEAMTPPPRTSHSLPASLPSSLSSQRMYQYPANTFVDSKDTPYNSLSPDSGFRPKSRIHPPVDSKTQRHPEHSVSLIPGFITREDREKTTMNDITDGEFSHRSYSCSPKNVHPEDLKKHQAMKVMGENVKRVMHPKLYNGCPNSWRANGSVQGVRHGSPASMLYYHKPSYEKQTKRLGAHVYDQLDRKGVLPSLTVQAKSLKKRSPQYDENYSEDYMDYRDAYDVTSRYHVGGIENSLKCLSEQGAPTKIERMLTFHLELNLDRFRTCKDYSPLETSPSELAKYYSTPTFNLTQGEVDIRKGLMSNASKRKRGNLRNPDPLSRDGFSSYSTAPEYQKLQSRKARIFDHLKALENKMPDYGLFERNDSRGMSNMDKYRIDSTMTEEELMVPNDTPRTIVDSRISFKPTEVAIEEQSKETQTSSTDTSEIDLPTVGKDMDKRSKIPNDNVPVRGTPRRDKMSQKLEIKQGKSNSRVHVVDSLNYDKDGKTFLTSDNHAHITVSG